MLNTSDSFHSEIPGTSILLKSTKQTVNLGVNIGSHVIINSPLVLERDNVFNLSNTMAHCHYTRCAGFTVQKDFLENTANFV